MSDAKLVSIDPMSYPLSGPMTNLPGGDDTVDTSQSMERSDLVGGSGFEGAKKVERTSLPVTNNSDVSLRFKVDDDSHEITVFVIDRASKRIIRSIPPEELNKLNSGDLLELVA